MQAYKYTHLPNIIQQIVLRQHSIQGNYVRHNDQEITLANTHLSTRLYMVNKVECNKK